MANVTEGVHLHLIPTKKFKTVSVQVKFKTRIHADKITKRALLANILEINNQLYPNQSDFRRKLSELYGASFYTDVARYGNYHVLSFNIDFIDEKIINDKTLFSEAINFLYQAIYSPNVIENHFHKTTFYRELDKLRDDYASRYDDKMTYAEDHLYTLYFDASEQSMTSYGQESDLDTINPENLYESYLEMINHDQIDIYVVGDINRQEVAQKFDLFSFEPRKALNEKPYYSNSDLKSFIRKEERQEINQTILTMGLETPIYFHSDFYYAGLVFNGLFGSMPHSKLFKIVREKENLAYSISSEIDSYRGLLLVYAGIESRELTYTETLILKQIEEMKQGNFSEKEITLTKETIKNELVQIDDTPYSMIERDYNLSLVGHHDLTVNEWIKRVDQVTKNEIIELARLIKPKATFILIGEKE